MCETHPEIFVDKIYNFITLHLSLLRKEDPLYDDLEKGGNIIWHNYYKKVREKTDNFIDIVEKLNNEYNSDTEDAKYIKLFVKSFGKFVLFTVNDES